MQGTKITRLKRVMTMNISTDEARLAIVPELPALIEQRYHLLKLINVSAPVGRRTLSAMSGCSEREVRSMLELLKDQQLIEIAKNGVTATKKGIEVLFALHDTVEEKSGRLQLANDLARLLGIRQAVVVEGDADESAVTKKLLGMQTAKQFRSLISGGKIVAVTGGSTVAAIAPYMQGDEPELLFIAARGGVGEELGLQANAIAASFAAEANASYKAFYYPDRLSDEAHAIFRNEPAVKEMMALYDAADCVIHGVGDAGRLAQMRKSPEEEQELLKKQQASGEAFGYYFNKQGEIVHRIRTAGIQMEQLENVPLIFAVAGGASKAEALLSYMESAPEQTILLTDEAAARKMLASLTNE